MAKRRSGNSLVDDLLEGAGNYFGNTFTPGKGGPGSIYGPVDDKKPEGDVNPSAPKGPPRGPDGRFISEADAQDANTTRGAGKNGDRHSSWKDSPEFQNGGSWTGKGAQMGVDVLAGLLGGPIGMVNGLSGLLGGPSIGRAVRGVVDPPKPAAGRAQAPAPASPGRAPGRAQTAPPVGTVQASPLPAPGQPAPPEARNVSLEQASYTPPTQQSAQAMIADLGVPVGNFGFGTHTPALGQLSQQPLDPFNTDLYNGQPIFSPQAPAPAPQPAPAPAQPNLGLAQQAQEVLQNPSLYSPQTVAWAEQQLQAPAPAPAPAAQPAAAPASLNLVDQAQQVLANPTAYSPQTVDWAQQQLAQAPINPAGLTPQPKGGYTPTSTNQSKMGMGGYAAPAPQQLAPVAPAAPAPAPAPAPADYFTPLAPEEPQFTPDDYVQNGLAAGFAQQPAQEPATRGINPDAPLTAEAAEAISQAPAEALADWAGTGLQPLGDPLGFDSAPMVNAQAPNQTLEGFEPGPAVQPDWTGVDVRTLMSQDEAIGNLGLTGQRPSENVDIRPNTPEWGERIDRAVEYQADVKRTHDIGANYYNETIPNTRGQIVDPVPNMEALMGADKFKSNVWAGDEANQNIVGNLTPQDVLNSLSSGLYPGEQVSQLSQQDWAAVAQGQNLLDDQINLQAEQIDNPNYEKAPQDVALTDPLAGQATSMPNSGWSSVPQQAPQAYDATQMPAANDWASLPSMVNTPTFNSNLAQHDQLGFQGSVKGSHVNTDKEVRAEKNMAWAETGQLFNQEVALNRSLGMTEEEAQREAFDRVVAPVVDSFNNRAAVGGWMGKTVEGVMEKGKDGAKQYSPMNGRKDVSQLPAAPPSFGALVDRYQSEIAMGAQRQHPEVDHYRNEAIASKQSDKWSKDMDKLDTVGWGNIQHTTYDDPLTNVPDGYSTMTAHPTATMNEAWAESKVSGGASWGRNNQPTDAMPTLDAVMPNEGAFGLPGGYTQQTAAEHTNPSGAASQIGGMGFTSANMGQIQDVQGVQQEAGVAVNSMPGDWAGQQVSANDSWADQEAEKQDAPEGWSESQGQTEADAEADSDKSDAGADAGSTAGEGGGSNSGDASGAPGAETGSPSPDAPSPNSSGSPDDRDTPDGW